MPTKTFYSQSDLPLATQDTLVDVELEHGVIVQRKVFAGTRVPPDLFDGYRKATGENIPEAGDGATDYSSMTVADLQALADERELEVTGTGKDGNVVKDDLIAALQAAEQA